jgi:hypothetical protein
MILHSNYAAVVTNMVAEVKRALSSAVPRYGDGLPFILMAKVRNCMMDVRWHLATELHNLSKRT